MKRSARTLAGPATHPPGNVRLERCRALLERLDPERPPPHASAKEFRWQFRALRERVHLYAERLAAPRDATPGPDNGLLKAEMALDLSMQYFQDVFSPQREGDEHEDGDEHG